MYPWLLFMQELVFNKYLGGVFFYQGGIRLYEHKMVKVDAYIFVEKCSSAKYAWKLFSSKFT